MARLRAWHRPLPPALRLRFLPTELGNVRHYRGGNWQAMRLRVLARDGNRCRGCNRSPAEGARLSVHHIEGYSYYGQNKMENLITLCEICHPNLDSYQQEHQKFSKKPGGE